MDPETQDIVVAERERRVPAKLQAAPPFGKGHRNRGSASMARRATGKITGNSTPGPVLPVIAEHIRIHDMRRCSGEQACLAGLGIAKHQTKQQNYRKHRDWSTSYHRRISFLTTRRRE